MTIVCEFQNIAFRFACIVERIMHFCFSVLLFDHHALKNQNLTHLSSLEYKEQVNRKAEKVLLEYGDNILRLAYSYLHNISDAEDVLQDTLIQFISKAPEFKSELHKKAWLLRVAINISKNKIIHNKIRETDELQESLVSEEKEDLTFVWETVKELPSKYREVIHLFYEENYTTSEIAKILSKNEATVRSLLHRARAKLKESLKEVYDLEE